MHNIYAEGWVELLWGLRKLKSPKFLNYYNRNSILATKQKTTTADQDPKIQRLSSPMSRRHYYLQV